MTRSAHENRTRRTCLRVTGVGLASHLFCELHCCNGVQQVSPQQVWGFGLQWNAGRIRIRLRVAAVLAIGTAVLKGALGDARADLVLWTHCCGGFCCPKPKGARTALSRALRRSASVRVIAAWVWQEYGKSHHKVAPFSALVPSLSRLRNERGSVG